MTVTDNLHLVVADEDGHLAVFPRQEDERVQGHLELGTGADEGAADRFLLPVLPHKLQRDEPWGVLIRLQKNVVIFKNQVFIFSYVKSRCFFLAVEAYA